MKRCLMLLLPVILLLAGCGHAPQENESLESMTAPMTADHSQWQQEPYYILQFNVDSVISNAPNVTATASRVIISQGAPTCSAVLCRMPRLTVEIPAGETARLVLCGVDMHCERGPVIYSNGGGTVVLLLEDGTENTLSDGKSYLYSGSKVREAAISVEGDLLITGRGSLSVEAIHNDALRSEGTLAVAEGTLEITAWRDGLVAGQEAQISGGQLSIACGRTGLSASSAKSGQGSVTLAGGTVALICGGDGITAAGSLSATAGEYHITTGGGSGNASYGETAEKWGLWGGLPQQQPTEKQPVINREQIVSDSARGLSAGKSLALSGGTFTLDCSDAALYSVGSTKLSGSRVTISGGDTAITTQQAHHFRRRCFHPHRPPWRCGGGYDSFRRQPVHYRRGGGPGPLRRVCQIRERPRYRPAQNDRDRRQPFHLRRDPCFGYRRITVPVGRQSAARLRPGAEPPAGCHGPY